jgi:hypothetical protein
MVNMKKDALISAIVAEKALSGTTHCTNCGHCKATL